MPSMRSLLPKLQSDFPSVTFQEDDTFAWSPESHTVRYNPNEKDATALLLHELSHGLLDHHHYDQDVSLLSMETAAWEKAKELSATYEVIITETIAEDRLDTYRDWLHARSRCPECTATGYQSGPKEYSCPACRHQWRVNEARLCGLRRYSVKP